MDTLNLPGVKTEGTTETGQEQVVHATVTAEAKACPECKHAKLYAFGTRNTRYVDLPMHGRQALINLTRQRYRCRKCGHAFMPDAPGFDAQFRMTSRAVEWVEQQSSKQTFAYVAQQVGIEERSVRRVFWRYAQRKEKELIPTRLPPLGNSP
jgi:transposase